MSNTSVEVYGWSVPEFCKRHDMCRQTAYNEINSGDLPVLKIGKKTRITPEGEKIWLDKKTVVKGAA